MLKAYWFTEQLALAAKETSTWPEWVRCQSGLEVARESADTAPSDNTGRTTTKIVSDSEPATPAQAE